MSWPSYVNAYAGGTVVEPPPVEPPPVEPPPVEPPPVVERSGSVKVRLPHIVTKVAGQRIRKKRLRRG